VLSCIVFWWSCLVLSFVVSVLDATPSPVDSLATDQVRRKDQCPNTTKTINYQETKTNTHTMKCLVFIDVDGVLHPLGHIFVFPYFFFVFVLIHLAHSLCLCPCFHLWLRFIAFVFVLCYILLFCVVVSCIVLSCAVLSSLAWCCVILSYFVLPCLVLCCVILSCRVFCCVI
jgi:hypothetical protein